MKSGKFIAAIALITGLLFSWAPTIMADSGMKVMGTITILKKGPVTIHSYMGPGAMVTSQIIETKNKLVVIDAQFIRPYAQEVRNYANRLNKPIDRVIVSHNHPDHWFGLEFFTDVPIYSLQETRDQIDKTGDVFIKRNRGRMGELVTDQKILPNMTIKEGKETIDGLEYEFVKVSNAEAQVQLLIKFPELGTLVAQDLVYNNVHLVIGAKGAINGWKQALIRLERMKEYQTILAGHGEPTNQAVYNELLQYLENAEDFLATSQTGDEYKQKLLDKYPSYGFAFAINISISRLFKDH
jgi:glyoxylase-like metal-dependent hydrolase (beta-lactamase superfamily II)